jgi:hypothetical protein
MTQSHTRPEDRRRSGIDSCQPQPWADTHPGCFRSEGFAEDLPEATAPAAPAGAPRAWTLRRRGGTLPLLSLALAGMLGVFSR